MVLFAVFMFVVALTRKEANALGGAMGICLLAIREVIVWMVALEARQCEISKNLSRW